MDGSASALEYEEACVVETVCEYYESGCGAASYSADYDAVCACAFVLGDEKL